MHSASNRPLSATRGARARHAPAAATALLAALALFPATTRAQPAPSELLDLETVRALAREASFDVRAAETRVEAARADVRRAWAPLIPSVFAGLSGTVFDREIALELPEVPGLAVEAPVFQHRERLDLAVGFDTVLLDARTFARADAAEGTIVALEARREAVADRAEWAAIDLVYRVATVDGLLGVAERQVERQRAHVEAVQRRLDLQVATRFELSRAETALVEAETQRDDLRYARRQLLRALALLLERSLDFELAPPRPPHVPPEEALEPSEDTDRAELLAASASIAAAEDARRAVTLDWLPRVVATGQYTWSTAEAIDGQQDAWNLVFGLRWTLFDRGLRRAARQEADARLREATIAAERARAEVDAEIDDARDALENARRRADQAAVRLETAERALLDAEAGRDAEVLTSLDVLDAEAQRAAAENGVVAARLDVDLATWRLAWALGAL
jgi:outer membrane protein TolC